MKLRKEDVYEHLELLYEIVGQEKYLEIVRMYGGKVIFIYQLIKLLLEIAEIEKLRKDIMELMQAILLVNTV